MPSLRRPAHVTPFADTRSDPLHQQKKIQQWQHRWPWTGNGKHIAGKQGHSKQRPGIHQRSKGVALPLLLGLGLSFLSSGAIATPVPVESAEPVPPSIPTSFPHSVALPYPLAQGVSDSPATPGNESVEEAIQGDSEARTPESRGSSIYTPIRIKSGRSIEDTLTTKDIPMGQGSFARDYVVTLKAKDQIAIDLFSESFDTVVTLMSENGTTLGENDDGPDGGTNSLLFMRINEDGDYVVRVRGFGQAKGGPFKLKLTRLKATQ